MRHGLCILENNSITQVIMCINKLNKVKNYKVDISSDNIRSEVIHSQ